MDHINTLNSVIYVLNTIEVKGKANLDRLLASIQTLEKMKEEMQHETDHK